MMTSGYSRVPRRLLVAGFLLCAVVAAAGSALADGMFLTSMAPEIRENSQMAFIRHENGQEDLRILPAFYGNAREFAWIVPVPAIPTLETADAELFYQAATLAQPHYQHRDAEWGCSRTGYDVMDAGQVEVLREQLVGIYRTMIIGADDSDALVDSLTAWGFLHDQNTAAVTPVLQAYVDRGWYFATMKVDSTALSGELPYLDYYWYGQMQPIRFTFASEEMVYPLEISAVSASSRSEVVIYTVGDHRMAYPGAETWYANKISASELSAIRRAHPTLGAELEVGDFFTKLVRDYTPAEMTTDLVISRAASDDEFRLINYSGFPLFSLFLGGSLLGWIGLKIVRRRARRASTGEAAS